MVHASIRMLIPAAKRNEVLGVLNALSRKMRFEPGCLRFHVYRDGEVADGILLDELWSDQESLDNHFRSPDFFNLLLISEVSSAPPEFRFETIQNYSGIEAVEKARSRPPN